MLYRDADCQYVSRTENNGKRLDSFRYMSILKSEPETATGTVRVTRMRPGDFSTLGAASENAVDRSLQRSNVCDHPQKGLQPGSEDPTPERNTLIGK